MKLAPPYPSYPFFREPSVHFCTKTLIDLSILAYSPIEFIKRCPMPFRLIRWIDEKDTQALVVEDPITNERAVAFRGTSTFNAKDWATDFNVCMGRDGIHHGFSDAYLAIKSMVNHDCCGHNVFFTGHSLGGALATIAALCAAGDTHNLVTFGSPRVGDSSFAGKVTRRCGPYCDRYVHGEDMVPSLPPESFGYAHVGPVHTLTQRPKPWTTFLTPRPVYDHIPTLYGDALWGAE